MCLFSVLNHEDVTAQNAVFSRFVSSMASARNKHKINKHHVQQMIHTLETYDPNEVIDRIKTITTKTYNLELQQIVTE